MHALGQPVVQHLRLAEALLPARRRLLPTFRELMETTDWDAYGRQSGNPKCRDCMVHCGYEPSAVAATFGSLPGFLSTARATLLGIS